MAWVSYFSIKRSGGNLVGVPKYSAYLLGGNAKLSTFVMMRDANRYMDGILRFLTFF